MSVRALALARLAQDVVHTAHAFEALADDWLHATVVALDAEVRGAALDDRALGLRADADGLVLCAELLLERLDLVLEGVEALIVGLVVATHVLRDLFF